MAATIRCDGIARRDLLRVGGLSALGVGLGDFFRLRECAANAPGPKAKSCILIWLDGGPSHLETFDPKPQAPPEVRGPMTSIATNIPGVRIGECLERTSQMLDQLAVVRSVTSPLGEHNFGSHYLQTGHKPTPALVYPSFGATLAHVRAPVGVLPPNIAVPGFKDYSSTQSGGYGFLPSTNAAFSVGDNPDKPNFKVRDLDFYQGLDLTRLDRRRQIVNALDAFSREKDANGAVSDPHLERAYNLIASQDAKRAFNLDEEPDEVRRKYGRVGGNGIGQCCLLARRLVERGVSFVTVNSRGWDTHENLLSLKERYPGDHNAHLPSLDRALSGLVEDLNLRGLLEETLVVVMGEFGRTPRLNTRGGRDHWPNVFSVALAGGGIRGGQVFGRSDALGESPHDAPVTPSDLAATIYTLLGISPSTELHTADGRPVRLVPDGSRVLNELIS